MESPFLKNILIVGAGFAGAVYARVLAEAGHSVRVIDRRPHIAGNCFDAVDKETGVRVHRYGPHLFHTSNMRVVDWLSRFTDWLPYEHKVRAKLPDGRLTPLPVNLDTVSDVFGIPLADADDLAAVLDPHLVPCDDPQNAEQFLYAKIGPELTDLFYRPYSRKMWQMDLADTGADVVKRLQIRTDRENRYFPQDSFQAMPADGYTALFERLLDHPSIAVSLDTAFSDDLADAYDVCFNSMPIDEYHGEQLGDLPYRSIRFRLDRVPAPTDDRPATVNYTDDGPHTRETWWHLIPGHRVVERDTVVRTVEEPCDYKDNDRERFYPVKTSDGRYDALYARYAALPTRHPAMHFIGRCGTYQYLDMHQVINQSLIGAEKWLQQQ